MAQTIRRAFDALSDRESQDYASPFGTASEQKVWSMIE